MEIKICGMASEINIREIIAACNPDYLGLIFHTPSPRNAIALPLSQEIGSRPRKGFVGVFVDKEEDEIIEYVRRYRLTAVQLHGSESPELCMRLRKRGFFKVWKAVGIESADDFQRLEQYAGCVDRFVFDRKSPSHGGTGVKFDWRMLSHYNGEVDFMLGGGIGPDDDAEILRISHPRLAGLDLNSCFEVVPGVKNSKSLESFIRKIRSK
ncbi:MAG: phosphoribosylanthranilate isomerase [Duncaniella sp.]|uniref:phosphoribosylanthranilate isomerase n=1 Tax=Duncaniella sp. TaxID=2518496 RepID=UPI0023C37986|nr:phosphoribosylanthranilate isomerase [Duncaniella sp.]MDE5988645.1 phosphoribosylanthranilate isomerase [Duncaniella sp.]